MAEYTVAGDPEIVPQSDPIAIPMLDPGEQLRRADIFIRLPSLISYDKPINETLSTLASAIVEHTKAVAAGVNLISTSDLTTIAVGYCNLPAGYLEGMQQARQTSQQGEALRERAVLNRSWVLHQAPGYMLSRPEYAHMYHLIRQVPFETLIGTSFMNRPETMGFVFLYYDEQTDVDDGEVALARAIADFARPLIDNAWLFGQMERRAAELEALSKADQALHESLHLGDVYEAMLDLAVDLFGADRSLFLSFDERGRLHAQATRGVPEHHLAGLQEVYHRQSREDFAGRSPELTVMEDVEQEPRMAQDIKRNTTSKSVVDIPVFVHGQFFGIFVLGYHQRRRFDAEDRALFKTLAIRAGLAIQNAMLFQESSRRTTELEALYRADEALHQSLHLDNVLEAMVNLAVELMGASSSLVVTWNEEDRLDVRASHGVDATNRQRLARQYSRWDRAHFAAMEVRDSLIEDLAVHPKIDPDLRAVGPRSLAELAVTIDGQLWGFFAIGWSAQRTFNDDDRRLFQSFTTRASVAIKNAQLFDQAQVSASLEERQRIARELHDSVSQALYGIGLGARTLRRRLGEAPEPLVAEPLEYIINLAEGGLAETRALIFELMPDSLQTDGLVTALQRQAAATQARHNVTIAAMLCDEPELPLRTKEALYRIAQESLHNMAKHAHATAAVLSLAPAEDGFVLFVRDDGRGFDTGQQFPGHLGLRSMQERARRIGGEYSIRSAPGEGTTVTVSVPHPAGS
jgi:signal transduction histidine kinase